LLTVEDEYDVETLEEFARKNHVESLYKELFGRSIDDERPDNFDEFNAFEDLVAAMNGVFTFEYKDVGYYHVVKFRSKRTYDGFVVIPYNRKGGKLNETQ